MTTTTFSMIKLPKMTAAEAVALMLALETRLRDARAAQVRASEATAANARGRKPMASRPAATVPVAIPEGVAGSARRMAATRAALEGTLATTADAGGANRAALRRLFGRYAGAWRRVRELLALWSEVESREEPTAAEVRAAMVHVFGARRGLAFLAASKRSAWTVGRRVLERLEAADVVAVVTALGGAVMLRELRAAHAELGAALGVTAAAMGAPKAGGETAPALADAQAAVREYVLKVHAMVDPEAPGSEALAAGLLQPLEDARKPARRAPPKVGKTPVEPAKPVAEPAKPPVHADDAPAQRPTGTG